MTDPHQRIEFLKQQLSNSQHEPQLSRGILAELRSLYFEQGQYLEAFHSKQQQLEIEHRLGFRPFRGVSQLQPQPQAVGQQLGVAREIPASGRQQDLERLVARINSDDHQLTVLHGQSGVGKSSLLKAGLIPVLQQVAIGAQVALPIMIQFYTDWVGKLSQSLTDSLVSYNIFLPNPLDSQAAIIEQLRQNAERNLLTVLILDQFEEFFSIYVNPLERHAFFRFLYDCFNIPSLKVILSLREDYLHYLLEYNSLTNLDILNKNILFYLGNFSSEQAQSLIIELTEQSQFYLEPELINEVVRDLAPMLKEVRPIQLQVVGAQLQTHNITTLEHYREHGSQEQLMQRYLEDVVKDCGPENERAAQLVLSLLTPENRARPLKTRAEIETELTALAPDLVTEVERLDLILEILVESGLVFLLPEFPSDRYQLVHDYLGALIRQHQHNLDDESSVEAGSFYYDIKGARIQVEGGESPKLVD